MPTIDQLDAAVVSSDDDVLPVSQAGMMRRVTRSQLLAGTQSSLSLTTGLLGRASVGLGPPQPIAIGNGLKLVDGTLSALPPYATANLPNARSVSSMDLIAVGQDGQDRVTNLKTLLSTPGIEAACHVVQSPIGAQRSMHDWLNDALSIEAFGAVGDGVTDDSHALNAAIATGRPVLLGPKTYRVDGQLSISQPATLVGVLGLSTLRRAGQRGGAWISISGASFAAMGITFDAGSIVGDSWGVLVTPTCRSTTFWNSQFINSTGRTLGCGLVIQARDDASGPGSSHSISDCSFINNELHGLWIQAAAGAKVHGCNADGNGGYGICLDHNDPNFDQLVRDSVVTQCMCRSNVRGISIGNYNETNLEPPRWGLNHPDAVGIVVSANACSNNSDYGIAVSGTRIQVSHNIITAGGEALSGSGILCNASSSLVADNLISGPGPFGIDAGGCTDVVVADNHVQNFAVGINAGGNQRVRVSGNTLSSNDRALTVFQMETDGRKANFGIPCADIWIERNVFQIASGCGGLYLVDGPERVIVHENRFHLNSSADLPNLLWCGCATASFRGNSVQPLPSTSAVVQAGLAKTLVIPDLVECVTLADDVTQIERIATQRELALSDQVTLIAVVQGGSGYNFANVLIAGSGSGAIADAYIRDGTIVGIALRSGGAGYQASSTSVLIQGDGSGAALKVFVGLPPAQARQLTLKCNSDVVFSCSGEQHNWTGADITVPATSSIVWQSGTQGWSATCFANTDNLRPDANGGASFRSRAGDLSLLPGGRGVVRISSSLETMGYTTSVGRGSPEGLVKADPGSDFRNLDGGVGSTLWIKQTGRDSSGWVAIA